MQVRAVSIGFMVKLREMDVWDCCMDSRNEAFSLPRADRLALRIRLYCRRLLLCRTKADDRIGSGRK